AFAAHQRVECLAVERVQFADAEGREFRACDEFHRFLRFRSEAPTIGAFAPRRHSWPRCQACRGTEKNGGNEKRNAAMSVTPPAICDSPRVSATRQTE